MPTQDYKSTLCLPRTGFPMRANLNQTEPEIVKRWAETKLQDRIGAKPAPLGEFILHDGPPYANGHIHVGHALNKILKDMVVRFRTMEGYRSPYVPGWDCHGLPIEQKVASELGKKKAEKTPIEIRQLCEEYAQKWVAVQSKEFQRLGVGGRWDRPYLTMDPVVEAGIISSLRDLVTAGYVYKGLKPVYWCASCQTALADAEVEYEDHRSPSIYVKFPFCAPESRPVTASLTNPAIVIWTTTPWTLPGNLAVSLHPDFAYVAIRVSVPKGGQPRQEDWIIAKELLASFAEATGIKEWHVIRDIQSRDLENMELCHPVQLNRTSRVILGTHVTLEQGTGAVHTAPGHGMEDFLVCQHYGIPALVPVDGQGRFTSEFPLMQGMGVWEANIPIIRYLDEKDLLVSSSQIEHSYPHCWRCHKPIIYRATEQWFMNVDHNQLRAKVLDQIDHGVRWIPEWGHDRIYNMVSVRPDWCLSRQRVWGVPIPAVVCKACSKATLAPEVISRFEERVRVRGTNCWFEEDVRVFLPDGYRCLACGSGDFEKEFNILDVWFESGCTHIAVVEKRERLPWPVDMYLEGSDQHRGWFQSSLLVAMGARNAPPFKSVLTHGFVLDGKGEAMSKSKGNVISPEEIIKKLGADVLRLWVASEDYRGDVKVSNEILERVGESYRRIRNSIRYLLGNLGDFAPERDSVPYDQLPEIDRWILHELCELAANTRRAYTDYEFHKIYRWVSDFCVVQLSRIYVDVLKDRLYCSGAKSALRRATQTVQYALVRCLLSVLAPILVFTCEEAYQYLDNAGGSIHLQPFAQTHVQWHQPQLAAEWAELLKVREQVLKVLEDARHAKKAIGQSLEARVSVAVADPELRGLLRKHEGQLAELFITSQADVCESQLIGEGAISLLSNDQVQIAVYPASGEKCERCWRILPSVGQSSGYPNICDRCVDVVRRYYSGEESSEV